MSSVCWHARHHVGVGLCFLGCCRSGHACVHALQAATVKLDLTISWAHGAPQFELAASKLLGRLALLAACVVWVRGPRQAGRQHPSCMKLPNFPTLCACTDDAKELLTKMGFETSLRYAIHLISASSLIASKRKAAEVQMEDVSRAYTLFVDIRRSVQYMVDYQEQYMYNQVPESMMNGSSEAAMQS